MKSLIVILHNLVTRKERRNLQILVQLLLAVALLVLIFTVGFHLISEYEGKEHSWVTGFYWTLVTMSTLGFGDITFESDLGRMFSVVVLLSGTVFMLILIPFTFIQFFFVPWMEAQAAARAPRALSPEARGHVVLTSLGAIEGPLIRKLTQSHLEYVILVPELTEALKLHDQGYRVMLGDLDDPETYRQVRVDQAALVATTRNDMSNTNVAFTVREISESVPIVATASAAASVDILELAGCNRVLRLADLLGRQLALCVLGRDARSHVVGQVGDLLIAQSLVRDTPLVGRTLRDIRLRDHANVSVVGVWDRGRFQIASPETLIQSTSVLLLAGSRAQLDDYDALFCIYRSHDDPVLIIGGGRVGLAVARALKAEGIDYRIIERQKRKVHNSPEFVFGNAAELKVLKRAGIDKASSVVITTRSDDVNVFLTIYCRRLRPTIQILARSNLERNVSTLHRAGADFVLSYASMGANSIFNLLQRMDTLMLSEGLSVFQLPIPPSMIGRSLRECAVRQQTGCNVIGVASNGSLEINPDANQPLPEDAELIVVGDSESERRFLDEFEPSA
ncbi:NAD-binding protein [Tautonia sp. JC769]|uniref:potassium channel family protein n=1 Tax=Tautonia sp. JC769 TaxID=3232135 RepID=UPI003459225A